MTFVSKNDSYLWEEWKERHKETSEDLSSKFLNLRFVSLEVVLISVYYLATLEYSLGIRILNIFLYLFGVQEAVGILWFLAPFDSVH